jgi:hypothetical protein
VNSQVGSRAWRLMCRRNFRERRSPPAAKPHSSIRRLAVAQDRRREHCGWGRRRGNLSIDPRKSYVPPSVLPVCGSILQLSRLTCRYP